MMAVNSKNQTNFVFPGGSKSRVNRAGDNVRNGCENEDDIASIDEWRAAHRAVLNTFQAILRGRTRNSDIVVAQRHKRKSTIFNKLRRIPNMQLARMDDVAGCRLIFNSIEELEQFRSNFHVAKFQHKRRNDVDKYDYIEKPKNTGYRGIHDVYNYDVNSVPGSKYKGLLVEIQYRTKIQHAWATAVEVIGFVTESQPKFQQGDERYQHAMALASELLARTYEDRKGPFPEKGSKELVEEFLKVDQDISLLQMLKGLNASETAHSENKNSILIFSESGELEVRTFRDAPDALRTLFRLEKEMPDKDIVLVRADSPAEVRLAFKNYFSDAKEFIELINRACIELSGRQTRLTSR